MKMSKLSNQTNSQDPQAVNSRVFVGNLNTFQCSKTDLERMFQRYGRLAGISMHKGYAFVQFTNPFDARNACHGEDGRTVLSQVLDVNMVAEPKPHQIGRKRQNVTKTGNDWDYYYDSYYASTLFHGSTPSRPFKRQRLLAPQCRVSGNSINNNKINTAQQQHQVAAAAMAAMAASAAAAQAVQANILPTQQIALHQQGLLQNNSTVNNTLPSCNGSTTNPHGLNTNSKLNSVGSNDGLILQQQQQQQTQTPSVAIATTSSTCNNYTNCEQVSFVCTNDQLQLKNQEQQQSQIQQIQPQQQQQQLLGPFKVYSNPDTLICGNCRECFSELCELLDHKRTYCKLRFTCKCQDPLLISKNPLPTTKLLCAVCKDAFTSPWDLMVHAQAAHMVNIYELGNENNFATTSNNTDGINADVSEAEESSSEFKNELDPTISNANNNNSSNNNGNSLGLNLNEENGGMSSNVNDVEYTTCSTQMNGNSVSPSGSFSKEDGNRDDILFDGLTSLTLPPLHHRSEVDQDIIKLNGSALSRGNSPALDNESKTTTTTTTRACIVRAVSIESTSTPPQQTIDIMNSGISINLVNEATVTQ